MLKLKQYKIGIFGLSNKIHHFNFDFDQGFFISFENSLVSKAKGTCKIDLTKTDLMIILDFNIKGIMELECDKSLEPYDHPINIKKRLIYKYGDEEKELNEDIYIIPKSQQQIDITAFLYELINLEVPMKKIHPKIQNEDDLHEMIYSCKENRKRDTADPRWETLKKLKQKIEIE